MAEANDIPSGTYKLELGSSFASGDKKNSHAASFHTLRYDFKPSSVSNDSETYVAYGNSGDVHVAVPSEGDTLNVFKGSKKEAKPKECLLFFDMKTNTVRLEKISSNINVKKTRDLDSSAEASLRTGIERLRTTSQSQPPKPETPIPAETEKTRRESSSSSSSSSGSGSDSSSDDDSDDETNQNGSSESDSEQKIVDLMNTSSNDSTKVTPPPAPQIAPHMDSFNNMPKMETSATNRNNTSMYGLALSESSDDDD